MAAELGVEVVLCGFGGGETGAVLESLVAQTSIDWRTVNTAGATGSYVIDRRDGSRRLLASNRAQAPSRHEIDDLVSVTCAAALESDVLVVCNPYPGEMLPLEVYEGLVANVRANGIPVLVDLSTPRLDSALNGGPELAKLNDWELAELVVGPVDGPRLRAAAEVVRDRGAQMVVVTRAGEAALVLRGDEAFELVPPQFSHGSREGCGDSMMGAIAAGWAMGLPWQESLRVGAAAGAANFLRHGLGSGSRATIDDLRGRVSLRPLPVASAAGL
jgi:1-phosphofructokinase